MIAFADTSGFGCFADHRQPEHAVAVGLVRQARHAGGRLVTTNLVLAELTGLLISPLKWPRPNQIGFLRGIRSAPWVEVVHVDAALDAAAWHLWETRADKNWSLVDCASFVVMRQRRLTDALTTDQHFEQAGFVRLLK